MDFGRPVSALIPGSTGQILEVLAATTRELNLSTVAEIAGVSTAQASRVLPRLVLLGIVNRRDVPPSALFALNREHVAAPAIETLVNAREHLVQRIRERARSIRPTPVSIALFGSTARGSGGPDSDIDLLVVRPDATSDDDLSWTETMIDWERDVSWAAGNPINVIEVSESELHSNLRSASSFWREVSEQAESIFGKSLPDLACRR